MNKLCTIAAALAAWFAATSPAMAWTLPDFGHKYFVGTTEELEDIRAALRLAECERIGPVSQTCIMGGAWCGHAPGCFDVPNPYCGENTWFCSSEPANILGESFGLGPVDCMQALEDYEVYSSVTLAEAYFGNTYGGTYVPALEELSSQSELPPECIAYMGQIHCWPGSGLEEIFCPDP